MSLTALTARDDGMINLCEIKYSQKKWTIDKSMARNLINKMDAYERQFPNTKHIAFTMITTMGLTQNAWANELIDSVVTLDDLF